MDLKKPLTFDEQLDKLIAHGMIVADREKAKDIPTGQRGCTAYPRWSRGRKGGIPNSAIAAMWLSG